MRSLFKYLIAFLSPQLSGDNFIEEIENKFLQIMTSQQKQEFQISDPFFGNQKKPIKIKKAKVNFKIQMILNNKVKIGGSWFKVGDSYKGFQIVQIKDHQIVVSKMEKFSTISLKQKEFKININSK
jgi:hypothetical protein